MGSSDCLKCAFCSRKQDRWVNYRLSNKPSTFKTNINSLTVTERKAIREKDSSFVGEQERMFDAWKKELEGKEAEKLRQEYGDFPMPQDMMLSFTSIESRAKQVGMSKPPDKPDDDYLACFNERWNLQGRTEEEIVGCLSKKRKCPFYYPYKDIGLQTMGACEKSRLSNQQARRFRITNGLVVVGIITTLLLAGLHSL